MNKLLLILCLIFLFGYVCNERYEKFENKNVEVRLYYAPWCGHCKDLKPKWNKLKKGHLKNKVTFTEINGDDNLDLCKERNVEGFPTIRVVKNGKENDYDGRREIKDIVYFIEKFIEIENENRKEDKIIKN